MKRFLYLITLTLALAGCGSKPAESAEPVPEETPEATEAAEVAETPVPDTPDEAESPAALPENLLEFLDGGWTLASNDSAVSGTVTLDFRLNEGTVQILTLEDSEVIANVTFFESHDDPKIKNDAMRFEAVQISDDLKSKFGDNMVIYSSDMQFFIGTFETQDFLFLRELGNGFSFVDSELLKEENIIGDYGWVFVRDTNNHYPTLTDNETLRVQDGTIYARRWMDGNNAWLLQEVDVIEGEENWYGDPLHTLRIIPADTEYPNYAYLYYEEYSPSAYSPALVKATISGGKVTSVEEIKYLGYDAYQAD